MMFVHMLWVKLHGLFLFSINFFPFTLLGRIWENKLSLTCINELYSTMNRSLYHTALPNCIEAILCFSHVM